MFIYSNMALNSAVIVLSAYYVPGQIICIIDFLL